MTKKKKVEGEKKKRIIWQQRKVRYEHGKVYGAAQKGRDIY